MYPSLLGLCMNESTDYDTTSHQEDDLEYNNWVDTSAGYSFSCQNTEKNIYNHTDNEEVEMCSLNLGSPVDSSAELSDLFSGPSESELLVHSVYEQLNDEINFSRDISVIERSQGFTLPGWGVSETHTLRSLPIPPEKRKFLERI
jgi:hypothetical protein